MKSEAAQKILQLSRDNYQAIALDFDRSRQKEISTDIYHLASLVQPGQSILDAGCGNGRLIKALPAGVGYLGIDNSPALISLARQHYPQASFEIMDILDLSDLPANHYDHIFCLAVLAHIPGRQLRQAAVREMASRLKDGGQLVISVWNLRRLARFRPLIRQTAWRRFWRLTDLDYGDIIFPWKNASGQIVSDRYYHAFRWPELLDLARSANLQVTKKYLSGNNYWLILNK